VKCAVLFAVLFGLLGACNREAPSSKDDARVLPTTSADIWLANLDGQIAELTRLTREYPELRASFERLSAAHHTRGLYRGDPDEIQRGIDVASRCVELDPRDARCHLVRAEGEQSLHRFAAAKADLELARDGADPVLVRALEAELDWNGGRYDSAVPAIRAARRQRPSLGTWLREAQLEHDLGRYDEADAAFDAAKKRIVDTSPFAIAHLELQRGLQRVSRGRLEEACVFFRRALAYMPDYIAAQEHLAEALQALGEENEAAAIYANVVAKSNDPEFMHALATLRRSSGAEREASELDARARGRYEVLLERYPEAMAWHASEFFTATGDLRRATALLRDNVALRPNSESYVALARAELANGDLLAAKKSIDAALAMPVVSGALYWTARGIYERLGDAAAAARFRALAHRCDSKLR
jgi:tetratricopeptide (TPR) repeat protein